MKLELLLASGFADLTIFTVATASSTPASQIATASSTLGQKICRKRGPPLGRGTRSECWKMCEGCNAIEWWEGYGGFCYKCFDVAGNYLVDDVANGPVPNVLVRSCSGFFTVSSCPNHCTWLDASCQSCAATIDCARGYVCNNNICHQANYFGAATSAGMVFFKFCGTSADLVTFQARSKNASGSWWSFGGTPTYARGVWTSPEWIEGETSYEIRALVNDQVYGRLDEPTALAVGTPVCQECSTFSTAYSCPQSYCQWEDSTCHQQVSWAVCSSTTGERSSIYPCKCGRTIAATEVCFQGQACEATEDGDGACALTCDEDEDCPSGQTCVDNVCKVQPCTENAMVGRCLLVGCFWDHDHSSCKGTNCVCDQGYCSVDSWHCIKPYDGNTVGLLKLSAALHQTTAYSDELGRVFFGRPQDMLVATAVACAVLGCIVALRGKRRTNKLLQSPLLA